MALQGGSSSAIQGGSLYNPQRTSSSGLTMGTAASAQFLQPTVGAGINQSSYDVNGRLGSITGGAQQVNGPTVTQPAADPYAAWGGTTAYRNMVNNFGNQKNNIFGTAQDAANSSATGYRNSILDLVDSLKSGQTAVDNRGINNDLAKQRGVADIMSGVNRGIQSGNVMLANKNAGDSSAAGAIARAYGSIGQRQLSDVGNQYELENQDISLAQQDLDTQRAGGLRRLEGSKDQAVNSIVSEARNSLAQLDAAMANASLPDRIQIDAEKNNIRNQVLQTLSQYDTQLQQGVGGIHAMNGDARLAEATRRGQLGQDMGAVFDYQENPNAQFQNTGSAGDLPIFTYRNRRQTV